MDIFTVRRRLENAFFFFNITWFWRNLGQDLHIYMGGGKYVYVYTYIDMCMYVLEKEMAIHSSIIAWKIPWTEEPGRLHSMGSQRAGHDWMN